MEKVCIFATKRDIEISYCFEPLRAEFLKYNLDFNYKDINTPEESKYILYTNIPSKKVPYPDKSFVWIGEPPVIFSRNCKPKRFGEFVKVFTWDDRYVNGKNIIKTCYPQVFHKPDFDISKKEKLCALITRNKDSARKGELFSERQRAIEWFDKNAPCDFDLYGRGWDEGYYKHALFFKYKKPAPKTYRGAIADKLDVLKKYKFSICYENWDNDCGYITEKIFDCFFASNVPVYLGARNISDYVPDDCFIDKRKFKDYDTLYKYIKNMPEQEYVQYLKNIEKYINGADAQRFGVDWFVKTVVSQMVNSFK